MKLTILVALLASGAFWQVQEPDEYPPGWFCTPMGDQRNGVQTADHPCSCQRMNTSPDCDDVEKDSHDPACGQYCHEKHCACKITCAAHAEPA
jgi:hypothetical protein